MNLKLIRRTEIWKEKRSMKIGQNPFCECCGGTKRLSVHHNRKAKNEEDYLSMKDISILCSSCHYHLHKGFLRQCQMCSAIFSYAEGDSSPRESIRGHFWYCKSCCELFDECTIKLPEKAIADIQSAQKSFEKYVCTVPNIKRGNDVPPYELLHWM